MTGLTHKVQPDRSKINMRDPHELQYWVKHLNVTSEDLQARGLLDLRSEARALSCPPGPLPVRA